MFVTGFSPVEICVASVITHTFGFGSSRRNAHALPFVSSVARSSRKCWNERNNGANGPGLSRDHLLCIFQASNYAIPRSLRETVCRTYYRESSAASIFGNRNDVPKVSGYQVTFYATAAASTGFAAISFPTRSDNCAPLLVQ
jgi:hypothetical protein